MLFTVLSHRELVELVVLYDRLPEQGVVFGLVVQVVQGVVDGCDVVPLHLLQKGNTQWQLPSALDDLHGPCQVQLRSDRDHEVVGNCRLLFDVEYNGLVQQVLVGDLLDYLKELVVVESERRVVDHGLDGVVVLVVLDV